MRISKRKIEEAQFRGFLLKLIAEHFKDREVILNGKYYEYENGMFVLIEESHERSNNN